MGLLRALLPAAPIPFSCKHTYSMEIITVIVSTDARSFSHRTMKRCFAHVCVCMSVCLTWRHDRDYSNTGTGYTVVASRRLLSLINGVCVRVGLLYRESVFCGCSQIERVDESQMFAYHERWTSCKRSESVSEWVEDDDTAHSTNYIYIHIYILHSILHLQNIAN